jgi:hypothetical protein
MAFPHASFETYTALRDMDISHPDINGSWRLGQMASWSRWGKTTGDLAPITADSRDSFDRLEPFTTRVILFAINLGGKAIAEGLDDWRNFHTEGHRGDRTLSNSIDLAKEQTSGGDTIPALYMTDVFKLIPTPTAKLLDKQIKQDLAQGIDHVGRCAAILRDELKICMAGAGGQAPTLVAMGSEAFKWLTGDEKDVRIAQVVDEVLGDGASKLVRQMDHYTFGSGTHESRAAALHPVLEEIVNGAPDRAPEPAVVS